MSFVLNTWVHSPFEKLASGLSLQSWVAVAVAESSRWFTRVHLLWARSVTYLCAPASLCHLYHYREWFFSETGSQFLGHLLSDSYSYSRDIFRSFYLLHYQKGHWLTGEAVVRRGGSNCITGGRNKLSVAEIPTFFSIFLSQFLLSPKHTLWE